METKEAKIKNLLTPYCNILALHKNGMNIPEDEWNRAQDSFDKILILLKETADSADNMPQETANSADNTTQNRRELLNKFFTKNQIEYIEDSLSQYHPQTRFISDMKFVSIDGYPENGKGCFLYYLLNSDEVVGCNMGYYSGGFFWFATVRNGTFGEDMLLNRNVIGYIYLNE